jgi:hypothetical protein
MGWMFSVAKLTLWILMLRGTRVRARAQNGRRTYTPDDREASYRGLVRDVVLGSLAVIVLSLAVPAWIVRVEYSKTYGRVPGPGSVAEVLRERTLETVAVTPRLPRVLELAEHIVRRETERRENQRREAESRETTRPEAERHNAADSTISANTGVPSDHAAQQAKAVPFAVNSPQFYFRDSVQAP